MNAGHDFIKFGARAIGIGRHVGAFKSNVKHDLLAKPSFGGDEGFREVDRGVEAAAGC